MSDDANIFNERELMCLIKNRLTPRHKEKKQFGEVFTPLWLVERMINKVPEEFYRHPEYKILGPSVGIGNFQVGLYYKLMETLKDKIPNDEKRRKHILENMLYMVELNQDNKEILENILNPERKYKLNIRCGDFLTMDVLKEFGVREGFDMVIENPPYNSGKKLGAAANKSIWDKFVEKSLDVIKPGGYLVMVHPGNWRRPEHKLWKPLTSNQILYLEIHNVQDGKKTFQSDTRYDWYVLKKTPVHTITNVIDERGGKISVDFRKLNFLPNYFINEIQSLVVKNEKGSGNSGKLDIYYDASTYHGSKPHSKTKTGNYKFPFVYGINKNGLTLLYSDLDINKTKQSGWSKVMISKGLYPYPYNDYNAEYGMSEITFGIPISSKRQGEEIIKTIDSPFFDEVFKATKWGAFNIDHRMFKHFDKEFYKNPIITSWKGLNE